MFNQKIKFRLVLSMALFAITAMNESVEAQGKIIISALPSNQTPVKDEIIAVPVIVDMSETDFRLGCIAAHLQWDATKLAFADFIPGATEGFTEPVVNINKTGEGKLIFAGINAFGTAGEVNVLTLRLQAQVDITQWQGLQLEVATLAAAGSFTDLAPLVEQVITGVESQAQTAALPKTFSLFQNIPNPFNPATIVRYDLPIAARLNLTVYNLTGQKVKTLEDGNKPAGRHSAFWNAKDEHDRLVASGIYFCRLEARANDGKKFVATVRMSLLR